jgi:hypothetical protein
MEKPFTNPLALEWLVKADADYVTANRELRARKIAELRCRLLSCPAVRGKAFKIDDDS